MRRRAVIAGVVGAAVAWPLLARAQRPRMPVIGFLGATTEEVQKAALLPAFRRGLEEAGFVEGRNAAVDYLWAEGRYERLPGLAARLVERRVDVMVAAGGTAAAFAAKAATATIPTVVLSGDDPVPHGLAAAINRPGGNITGVVQLVQASEGKRFELLRELVPRADSVAVLINPANPNAERQEQNIEAAAGAAGLRLLRVFASDDPSLDKAMTEAASVSGKALVVAGDPYFLMRNERIVALAAQHSLPAMYFFREFTVAGGLASYGSNLANAYYQLGLYAGRILKGAKPAEMPMTQQTDKLELVINLKTAKALGLMIPPPLLARADEVIE